MFSPPVVNLREVQGRAAIPGFCSGFLPDAVITQLIVPSLVSSSGNQLSVELLCNCSKANKWFHRFPFISLKCEAGTAKLHKYIRLVYLYKTYRREERRTQREERRGGAWRRGVRVNQADVSNSFSIISSTSSGRYL